MHGLIHLELRQFVERGFGGAAWQELATRAGVAAEVYSPVASYPDDQVERLVTEASAMTGLPVSKLLEDFGEHLVPRYLSLYGNLLKPEWRTLEVLENTEETIHRVVRLRHPGAAPPSLCTERKSERVVVLTYSSQRRLCAVARGIARGVAKKFGEGLRMAEPRCMLRGDPTCVIEFERVG